MLVTPKSTFLIVGALSLDSIETPSGRVEEVPGGAGFYSSLAASFFSAPRLATVAGTDVGQDNLGLLVQRGIDTLGVQIVAGKTFRWKARYGQALSHATTL
ncbi:sugar kinase, partial [bacterium]